MLPEISLEEVTRHNSNNSDWIVIHNVVYDVTKYLSEHPGGEETLLEVAGQEVTQSFEDIGHSNDAREIMKKYKVGVLPANEHSIANSGAPKIGKRHSPVTKSPSPPRIERRVNTIVVPRERGNWWKWALLLLAGAITVGLIAKKKMA